MAQQRPIIDPPEGEAPTELLLEDLVVGEGGEALAGKTVVVDYVGVSWSTGEEFDASWNRNETFSFGLGAGMVIAGWDQGVAGMKVGGRRRITIPPHLGYGSQGAGGVIAPNETLIFVVDLHEVH
jgi:peptidylprolyl isomerase